MFPYLNMWGLKSRYASRPSSMASKKHEEVCVTVTWTIRNLGLLKYSDNPNKDHLHSPNWKVEHTEGRASWKRLTTTRYKSVILFDLCGLEGENLPLDRCEMHLVLSSGREVPLRGGDMWSFFIERGEIFGDKTQLILPTDIVTLCCRMWEETTCSQEYHYHTVLRSVNCEWNLDLSNTWPPFHAKVIEKDNVVFDIALEKAEGSKGDSTNHWFVIVGLMPNADCWHSFVNCEISAKCAGLWPHNFYNSMRTIIRKECEYVPSRNQISINFQLKSTIALHEGSNFKFMQYSPSKFVKHEKSSEVIVMSDNTLSADLLHLYREALQSDATLMIEGKSFPVHRSILTARSPVLGAKLRECQSGVVRIDDVDSHTLERLLVFLYGGIVEEIPWNEAFALYYAADTYDVRPLKQKCVDMLKAGLATDNSCDMLRLADKHLDQELINCVVVFIRDHQEVFSSSEWKKLEEDNPRLTIRVFREVYVKK